MPTLLLIHGGLWEDIGTDWFWRRPGIVDRFERLGFTVVAPDRLRRRLAGPPTPSTFSPRFPAASR